MSKNKKHINFKAPKEEAPKKMRQIIIETDGNNINIALAEVAGNLELIAILNSLLAHLTNPPKK